MQKKKAKDLILGLGKITVSFGSKLGELTKQAVIESKQEFAKFRSMHKLDSKTKTFEERVRDLKSKTSIDTSVILSTQYSNFVSEVIENSEFRARVKELTKLSSELTKTFIPKVNCVFKKVESGLEVELDFILDLDGNIHKVISQDAILDDLDKFLSEFDGSWEIKTPLDIKKQIKRLDNSFSVYLKELEER